MAANPNAEFKLFESQQYGESDLLFKDATQCFVHTSHMDYRSILGEEFYSHAETVFNCTHSGTTVIKYTCLTGQQISKLPLTHVRNVDICFSLQQISWSFVIRTCAAYFNGHTEGHPAVQAFICKLVLSTCDDCEPSLVSSCLWQRLKSAA